MKKGILMGGLFALGAGLALGAIASADTLTSQNVDQTQKQQIQMPNQKQGNFKGHFQMTDEQKAEMQTQREQMDAILTTGDYQAYKNFVGDKPMADKITEENFAKFVEMHNLRKAGDEEGAKAIAEELGLNNFGERGAKPDGQRGVHKGMRFEDKNGDGYCDQNDLDQTK